MICRECGRNTENENANFCYYCGARLVRESDSNTAYNDRLTNYDRTINYDRQTGYEEYKSLTINEEKTKAVCDNEEQPKPFSILKFVGLMMLPYVFPPFSSIAFVVILLMYAFKKDNPYARNWAIAMLIVVALFVIIAFSMLDYLNTSGIMSSIQNGEFMSFGLRMF